MRRREQYDYQLPPSNTSCFTQDVQPTMLLDSQQERRNSEGSFTYMEEGDAHPSISVARTASSEGAAVDFDLLEQLLSGDNAWLEVATNASRSPNFFASPCTFLSDATTTTTTPASANNNLWIQSSSTFRQRLDQALAYIEETQRDTDVLVQLWMPVKSNDGQLVLTTSGQPFTLDKSSESLKRFRDVSTHYQFSADVASESSPVGLPGRVFIGKLPEWSPDVRYFTSYEYPRVNHAQDLDVHGTMGLPVFEKGNYSCLGVMELIMTRQKLNFTSEINNICSALQAVNLRSTEVSSIPRTKFNSASYKDALPEILEVLRAACITHKLPLAQTWVTCDQQGKRGSRHSDENYRYCISTIDAACYVNDPCMQNFHYSCSEHHLLRGQGVAGKAFTTNQPCFLPDIGSSTKLEYPLSHHAKIFNLKGAVAIRLRCTRTGTADFVLEFFLPTDCEALEEQKAVLDSLSGTMRSVCQTLRVVTDKEMEDEAMLEMNELNSFGPKGKNKVKEFSFGGKATEHREEASWTSLAGTSQKESDLAELSIHGMFSPGGQGSSLAGVQTTAQGSKGKRRTKTEKTVSLQVLRQYFAGSLKDAAKNLGVCPTTLKRICRQHGINRWPSRKIKKVDHSLRKLQQIIDSVHGGETAFQLNNLYKDLTNTSVSSDNNLSGSITVPLTKQSNLTEFEKHRRHRLSNNAPSTSHSHSSCSQSSDSSPSCSGGATKDSPPAGVDLMKSGSHVRHNPIQTLQAENALINGHISVQEARGDLLHNVNQKAIGGQHSSRSPSPPKQNSDIGMRVKATFGSEKVRFRLKPESGFQELKQEMARRLSIVDTSSLIVKYLDDDSEWVLMTCDADLQECLHVYKLANIQTVKISIHLAANPETKVTVGHTGLS
ncbi:protein NLP1 isoform X2 [Brachypodium distachyon]|uniref:protein NLP1 isoform X2 n=1 Tax=Brachypodium distachyon TaxID=15368 RepID=UPI00071DFCAB|nr:protein NLP1 isoform X2 [Brachypodium distachyon]|eukprot:XP_014758418.1 protein NLP1 isoform X2 [Brachypodium distachyon]